MFKKRICFIAQFPPPIHGLSKAVDTLYNSILSEEYLFEKIDITNNKKIFKNFWKIVNSRADLFYFTISQTKGGNLRDLLIMKILKLQNKKCLIHLHGGYYRTLIDQKVSNFQKRLNYQLVKHLDGAIVLSKSLRGIFKEMINEEKIHVVSNCVDDNYLMSDYEFATKLDNLNNKPIKHILYLSNFIETKGYKEVLEMAKLEKQRCDSEKLEKFHFDFAGKFFEKLEEEYFWNFIRDNELENYVTYHGVVDGSEKRALLKSSDYFILLSRYPNEGQPISILEAMGNGLVVLTTDHAGIPDVVCDGVNGLVLHENETVDVLWNRLENVNQKSMILKNREVVLTNYREQIYISNMRKCFEDIFNTQTRNL